ncbi:MAG: tetratricopeptide repeat protein [Candidatus Eremiobacterota bacterium]
MLSFLKLRKVKSLRQAGDVHGLAELLRTEKHRPTLLAAVAALADLGGPAATRAVEQWMGSLSPQDDEGRSAAYRALGMLDARAYLQNALRAEALNNQATLLDEQGEYSKALALYAEALELHPDCAEAWFNQANTLSKLGRPHEALDSVERALEIEPKMAPALATRGQVLRALGRGSEALSVYDQALALEPRMAVVWYNRANLLAESGRLQEAVDSYRRALALEPGYAQVWGNLGATQLRLNDPEAAEKSFRKALEIDPALESARTGLQACRSPAGPDARTLAVFRGIGQTLARIHDQRILLASPADLSTWRVIPGEERVILDSHGIRGARQLDRAPGAAERAENVAPLRQHGREKFGALMKGYAEVAGIETANEILRQLTD